MSVGVNLSLLIVVQGLIKTTWDVKSSQECMPFVINILKSLTILMLTIIRIA